MIDVLGIEMNPLASREWVTIRVSEMVCSSGLLLANVSAKLGCACLQSAYELCIHGS